MSSVRPPVGDRRPGDVVAAALDAEQRARARARTPPRRRRRRPRPAGRRARAPSRPCRSRASRASSQPSSPSRSSGPSTRARSSSSCSRVRRDGRRRVRPMSIVLVLMVLLCRRDRRCDATEPAPRRIGRTTHLAATAAWVRSAHATRQTSLCSYANAVAAAREDTPSLARMLLTWRSTVRSLRTSSAAIALVGRARGDQPQHLSSRGVSPWASGAPAPRERVHAGEVRRRSELLRRRCVPPPAPSPRRRRRRARGRPAPTSTRTRARLVRRLEVAATAARPGAATPSAVSHRPLPVRRLPRACATMAAQHAALVARRRSHRARRHAARASSCSPAASMIST